MNAPPPVNSGHAPNYMVWSIIGTVLAVIGTCLACLPFPAIPTGIVAIVFSSKVGTALSQGDIAGAQHASKQAKLWNWITTAILILVVLVVAAFLVFGGMDAYMQYVEETRKRMGQ